MIRFSKFIVLDESGRDIDVDTIVPEKKDYDRARGLEFRGKTFHGNRCPFEGEASKMAKSIKDPQKLVRRAKAVVSIYGTKAHSFGDEKHEIWKHFRDALERHGHSPEAIDKISRHKTPVSDYAD
jgi:hypothetical protein